MQISTESTPQIRRFIHGPLEFFQSNQIPKVLKLLVEHYEAKDSLNILDISNSNIEFHLQKLLKVAAEKGSSFVLKQKTNIVGISINLDVKDLLALFETQLNLAVFESLGMLNSRIRNSLYKYSSSQRGEYMFNIETTFQEIQSDSRIANKAVYVCRGIAFCKIMGWKNILFCSPDPFFFLKMGGEVIQHFPSSPQIPQPLHEKQIEKVAIIHNSNKSESNRYLIKMEMDNLCIYHPKHTSNKGKKNNQQTQDRGLFNGSEFKCMVAKL